MINKKDFNEFLSKYDLENLSKDDIYDICVEYKKLPKEEKNWGKLAEKLHWKGTAESLRCFTKGRQRKEGTLPKNERELNSRTIEDITADDLIDYKHSLMMKQQQVRDEWTVLRSKIRDASRVDSFKEELKCAIKELNKLPIVVKSEETKKNKNSKVEAILLLSDLHIGAECHNFYNTYNLNIATKRVAKLIRDTKKYCLSNKVSRLDVVNVGDLIHGVIHQNMRIEQEMDVTREVIAASELVANLLLQLSEVVPELVYRSCTDNHARISADIHQSIERENFGALIDWYLAERLKGTKIVMAHDNIDESMGLFTLMNGKKVGFSHGHLDGINEAFQHFAGATGQVIPYVLLGHYHCEKKKSYQGMKVFVNGSVVGTEQYALSKRLFSKPSQTLIIFDEDNEIDISILLDINE